MIPGCPPCRSRPTPLAFTTRTDPCNKAMLMPTPLSATACASSGLGTRSGGAVKLTADGRILHGCGRCSPCSADEGCTGDIAPGLKGAVTAGSMFGSGQEVATKLEEVVDLAVAGEEPLGVARRLNRCMCRSRRRVGWCETSARLLR